MVNLLNIDIILGTNIMPIEIGGGIEIGGSIEIGDHMLHLQQNLVTDAGDQLITLSGDDLVTLAS